MLQDPILVLQGPKGGPRGHPPRPATGTSTPVQYEAGRCSTVDGTQGNDDIKGFNEKLENKDDSFNILDFY